MSKGALSVAAVWLLFSVPVTAGQRVRASDGRTPFLYADETDAEAGLRLARR